MGEGDKLLASALDLASRGFRVFPLKPGDYRPAVDGWKTLATTDEAQIRRVWNGRQFNIGVAAGDGLLIVDVDMKNGKDGLASLKALGVELDGFVVETPTGGLHGYYRGPDVSNSVGRLGLGLDVRSAGGYVVGPGSTLAEGVKDGSAGGEYRRLREGPIGDAPSVIVQRLVAPVERRTDVQVGVIADTREAIERGLVYLQGNAEAAIAGLGGDETTYRVAARLKDFGISQATAVDLLAEHWNERCEPPWDHEDLKTKVANAYEYGTSPLGIAHPSVDFAGFKPIVPPEPETRKPSAWFRHGDARGKVNWLYRNLIPTVGVGVLLAPSQAGKTFLAIELARSLATGKEFFKQEAKELGATLFVFAGTEGSGLALRLDALEETDRLPISATTIGNLSEPKALERLLEALKEEAAHIMSVQGVPVRLIVLETMAASGLLQDENDNSEASRAMANLAQISRAMNAFVLTSHHPAKNGNGSRGASAIPSSADYVIEIIRHERAAVREVELIKARDAEQRKLGSFTLIPVDLGLDDDGEPITSMRLSMGESRIDLSRPPAYLETFTRSIEWGSQEQGEEVDGRPCINLDVARLLFRDLKTGSKERANYGKSFAKCQMFAEALGRLTTEVHDGKTLLFWHAEITVDDDKEEDE